MRDFPEMLRDRIGGLQLAFDKRWVSLFGLMSHQRAGRIVWGTRGPLELQGVERMSLGAAAVLARHNDDLRLPSLRELNPELARILAQHRHRLYLDGCHRLDADTARAIANHGLETIHRSWEDSLRAFEAMPSPGASGWEPGRDLDLADTILSGAGFLEQLTLSLSGLQQLPWGAACGLGKHRGTLILDGLKELSDEAAQELGNHFGSLELNGLRSLSSVAARALACGGGEWPKGFVLDNQLSLNGLKSIPPEAAKELAGYQGTLRLNGLQELTQDVAEALSGFSPQSRYDRLNLNGLRRLSTEATRELAPLRATLCLGGLKTVSPELAEAILEVRGRIMLPQVTRLSSESAEILLSRLEVYLSPCVL